jgi:hypothetical protein
VRYGSPIRKTRAGAAEEKGPCEEQRFSHLNTSKQPSR